MTTSTAFKTFVDALCAELDYPLDASGDVVQVCLNGVEFTLLHDPMRWGEGNVMFACDFGEVPVDDRAAILERLLMMNCDMQGLWSPIFSIVPQTGRLAAMSALPMQGLDGLETVETLMRYVMIVERWKTGHFLDDELPGTRPTGSAPASAPAPS